MSRSFFVRGDELLTAEVKQIHTATYFKGTLYVGAPEALSSRAT